MWLLPFGTLLLLCAPGYGNTSQGLKLEHLVMDPDKDVDKFLTNAYVQIGTFMAETLFFVVPKYQDYFNVVADIGSRFLVFQALVRSLNTFFQSLPEQVRGAVIEKFLKTGEINKTLDEMNGFITVDQEHIIIDMLTSYDIVADATHALAYAKSKDLKLGNRLEQIYNEGRKQYSLSSPEVRTFVQTELVELVSHVKKAKNQVNSYDSLKKAQKRFTKLPHEQKVEVTKIILSAFNDILKKYFNDLIDKLSQLHAKRET